MVFAWFRDRRRRRILQTPVAPEWRAHLRANMRHYLYLTGEEQRRLERLTQVFIAEKHWEGCGGLRLDDEIRVTIAGQACLLVLGLGGEPYHNVETIYVYPSTVVPRRVEDPIFAPPRIVPDIEPLIGEAHHRGPIVLTWDAVRRGGRHPERGHNVVYHEFAHKLDLLDGAADGTPPLESREAHERWVEVCTREYEALRAKSESGLPSLLDPYGATSPEEFFAVATESFFDTPTSLREQHPELYDVLRQFYRQDTAAREERYRQAYSRSGW